MDLGTESGFCASLFAIKGGLAGIQARRRYPHFSLFREAARYAGSAKKMRGPTWHECANAAAPKLRLSGWRDSWGVLARAVCGIAFCAWGARFFRRTLRALRIFAPAGWEKSNAAGLRRAGGKSGPFGRSASYAVFRILRAFYDVFKRRPGKRVADCGIDSRPYASGPAGF